MSAGQLAALGARLAVLELELRAQERISLALALALPIGRRAEFLETLTALQVNAAACDGRDAAGAMQHFIDRFVALTSPNLGAPVRAARSCLALEGALLASAPPDRKEAMRSWLAIATPQERCDEAAALLKSLPPLPDASRKRGKGGAS